MSLKLDLKNACEAGDLETVRTLLANEHLKLSDLKAATKVIEATLRELLTSK